VTEAANPNGSVLNIAGIANERFNVAGLMPHPDRAVEGILGTEDGRSILNSMISALESRRAAA
jgi:phosphoribosylformylglycinamidine synthase